MSALAWMANLSEAQQYDLLDDVAACTVALARPETALAELDEVLVRWRTVAEGRAAELRHQMLDEAEPLLPMALRDETGQEPRVVSKGAASPATVAALVAARKTKTLAAPSTPAPTPPPAPARRPGGVTLTLRPRCLADWVRWTHDLGVADVRMDSTGSALVADITCGGVPARLVGEGVPALLRAQSSARKVLHV